MAKMNAVRLKFTQDAMKMKSCLARMSIPNQVSEFIFSNMKDHLTRPQTTPCALLRALPPLRQTISMISSQRTSMP